MKLSDKGSRSHDCQSACDHRRELCVFTRGQVYKINERYHYAYQKGVYQLESKKYVDSSPQAVIGSRLGAGILLGVLPWLVINAGLVRMEWMLTSSPRHTVLSNSFQ